MKTREEAIFYREWIPLPKAQFNVLAMLAEQGGSFTGNYADMMRYLGVTVQDRNRQALRSAVEALSASGYITHESSGRTQTLTVIPKAREIHIHAEWVRSVLRHDYSLTNVAPAQLLKIFLLLTENKGEIITYGIIAEEVGVCESTVGSAVKILDKEYENIAKEKVSERNGKDKFRTLGQRISTSAWWTEI